MQVFLCVLPSCNETSPAVSFIIPCRFPVYVYTWVGLAKQQNVTKQNYPPLSPSHWLFFFYSEFYKKYSLFLFQMFLFRGLVRGCKSGQDGE